MQQISYHICKRCGEETENVCGLVFINKEWEKKRKIKMADDDQYGEGMEQSVKYIPWKGKN